ncbi:aldose epimerase family protein [Microbulbifer agarilyticus]|uniref:aldose epimerase family protein n=1 Tax=Microbulbifer agarilyticus TaxID=260552 RepID=UPI001CD3B327|nr:aldose epimerase family protein [Microbulbifer agarilyticus]MCA0892171.1 galactose mutarotase [Microbulbifer agarilyticus]
MLESVLLENSQGMRVTVVNYGARIASIQCLANGELREMTVTHADPQEMLQDDFYLGAICGPVCNRISNAAFSLNGTRYQLGANDGENCVHGGVGNISYRYWTLAQSAPNEAVLRLTLTHLEDGFPGNREFVVSYRLDESNALQIEMTAESDRDTPVNLTNHAYFSLGEQGIESLTFRLNSEKFLQKRGDGVPTGRFVDAAETGFRLKDWQRVGDFLANNQYAQILEEGVDHCFVMEVDTLDLPKAELVSETHKIKLAVFSDQPAMQVYSSRFLSDPFEPGQGLCFESQGYSDALNQPGFPSIVVRGGEQYRHRLTYQFEAL